MYKTDEKILLVLVTCINAPIFSQQLSLTTARAICFARERGTPLARLQKSLNFHRKSLTIFPTVIVPLITIDPNSYYCRYNLTSSYTLHVTYEQYCTPDPVRFCVTSYPPWTPATHQHASNHPPSQPAAHTNTRTHRTCTRALVIVRCCRIDVFCR